MLDEQNTGESLSLEHLQKEWEEAETFSSEDMAFFNGDIEESPSGWKRLAGVFTAEEVEQHKEPGKEYLSRYCGENMQDREISVCFGGKRLKRRYRRRNLRRNSKTSMRNGGIPHRLKREKPVRRNARRKSGR